MRIALDVDGVICNFDEWWVRCALSTGVELVPRPGQQDSWYMEKRFKLTELERVRIERALYTTCPSRMLPIDGAIDGIKKLMEVGHDVHFVTTSLYPNPLWEHGRRHWFHNHLGAATSMRLAFLCHKYIVSADLFVDDKKKNLDAWVEGSHINYFQNAVLFSETNGGSVRFAQVANWIELLSWIEVFGPELRKVTDA